jgi:hypothetical protein
MPEAVATKLPPIAKAIADAAEPLPFPRSVCVAIEGRPVREASVVASMIPEPLGVRLAPDPTPMLAVTFMLLVKELKAFEPPLPQVAPESVTTKEDCHCAQWPEVMLPDTVTMLAPAKLEAPIPPLAVGRIPTTPEVNGSCVPYVSTIDVGVPKEIPEIT